jgi:hypothetical protein
MCRPKIEGSRLNASAFAALAFGVWLGGCSDLYWDRRETIALGAGDAIAANTAVQSVNPWPPASGDRNIAFNGQKMQAAVQRYRTNQVIPPINATTSEFVAPSASAAPGNPGATNAAATSPAYGSQTSPVSATASASGSP